MIKSTEVTAAIRDNLPGLWERHAPFFGPWTSLWAPSPAGKPTFKLFGLLAVNAARVLRSLDARWDLDVDFESAPEAPTGLLLSSGSKTEAIPVSLTARALKLGGANLFAGPSWRCERHRGPHCRGVRAVLRTPRVTPAKPPLPPPPPPPEEWRDGGPPNPPDGLTPPA